MTCILYRASSQVVKVKLEEKVFIYSLAKYFIMEKIPGWIERLLMPKLNEITGEIKAPHTRIDAVEKEIASLDNKVDVRTDAVEKVIASLRNEMLSRFEAMDAKFEAVDSRFDSLEAKLPVMEKMAKFEIRLVELEKKLPSA